jgi:hypothetical protein
VATIAQNQLFGWHDIETLGDLERLQLLLKYLPDESVVRELEKTRGRGRDKFPVRPMWNAMLAGVVYEHPRVESLLRELKRNGQLRQVCGFELAKGLEAVPPSWAFSRFLAGVMEQQALIQGMFDTLVEKLGQVLPGFGATLAADGKAINSFARGKREEKTKKEQPGRRRDEDAEWGVHAYSGKHEDGTAWETVKKWFGYTLHLVVDAEYELPVAFTVSKAAASEVVTARQMIQEFGDRHAQIWEGCRAMCMDRAYDDGKLITQLWDDHAVLPIIDIRDCRKDGEKSRLVKGTENVVYDYRGTVSCVCLRTGTERQMAYGGFERHRGTLKYRCPAQHYGYECEGQDSCSVGKAIRIGVEQERRVFTPLPRHSLKWERLYDMRTAVERVNSRLDVSFGFEKHTIRGLKKMQTRCALALTIMIAMAYGRIMEKQAHLMRSLVRSA